MVRAICHLFSAPDAKPVGRIVAIVGAKGGVGASTVAHNVAWAIGRDLTIESVVADLDLPFGTAGLDYNQDPPQGIADAVFSPDRVDTAFVDRLLSKCTDHLSLLAAPQPLSGSTTSVRKPSIRYWIRFGQPSRASFSTSPINGPGGPGACS